MVKNYQFCSVPAMIYMFLPIFLEKLAIKKPIFCNSDIKQGHGLLVWRTINDEAAEEQAGCIAGSMVLIIRSTKRASLWSSSGWKLLATVSM